MIVQGSRVAVPFLARRSLALVLLPLLLVLGGAGFLVYRRWRAPDQRAPEFEEVLVSTLALQAAVLVGATVFVATLGLHQLYRAFQARDRLLVGVLWLYGGLPLGPFALILLPISGFCWPLLWLRTKVRRRQQAISVALPDLLDMLAVCVSAGMGFDVALTLLAERGEGPLYEELDRLLRELRIGEPREQAFRHLSERNSSEALRSFVDALLQAEELGSPIAATLERQAEDLRIYRRHRAREQGAKAATKICWWWWSR